MSWREAVRLRRPLLVSFLVVLVLLGLNLPVYFWSNQERSAGFADLQRAMSRRILVASITQNLSNLRMRADQIKQVAAARGAGAQDISLFRGEQDISSFRGQLESLDKQIRELQELSGSKGLAKSELAKAYLELSTMHAGPLTERIEEQLLPHLEEDARTRVAEARANLDRVERFTEHATVFIFVISMGLAIVLAWYVPRYFSRSLGELQLAARNITDRNFNYRVPVRGADELGRLAQAYNDMADSLEGEHVERTHADRELEQRNEEFKRQRKMAESLLLNILPPQVARELTEKGSVEPKYFEDVTILFADFVGFTLATEKLAAEDLVHKLHAFYTAFDQIVQRYYLEKLKTIGDSYMCVAGLPLGRRSRRAPSHPVDAVMAAMEMIRVITDQDEPDSPVRWAVRVGIHTGPVIAGVVGIQKFAFDVWGEAVNFSSRMETSGAPNRINISDRTWARVKDFFECEHRGRVLTKEKKEFDMYFVKGFLPILLDDPTQIPPPAFLRRYHVYFQKEPPSFPAFFVGAAAARGSAASR